MNEKIEQKWEQARNLEPNKKSKITSKANSSQAHSQKRGILTIPEEIKHTELGEINNHL